MTSPHSSLALAIRMILALCLSGCSGLSAGTTVPDPVDTDTADTDTDTADTDTDTAPPCEPQDWFADVDLDGFGDDATLVNDCEAPARFIAIGGDCNDSDQAINPNATALVDGVDSDCDGKRDWAVTFYITADDAFEWCLDHETNVRGSGQSWQTAFVYEEFLPSGTHTIGIRGWDLGRVITAATAHIEISDGTTWVTDGTWKYDSNPSFDSETRRGWCQTGFDDSPWQLVQVIGPVFTTTPWLNYPSGFPADSDAQWVWDHFPVDLNTQYLRKEFTLP